MHEVLQPPGWAPPIGYANGIAAEGRLVFVGGQIGWNAAQAFESDELVDQVRQTLANIVAVLGEAGAGPEHIVSMTWYLTDVTDYGAKLKAIGHAYRAIIGHHFPAMAVVEVSRLVEQRALVEIQAMAVVPTERSRSDKRSPASSASICTRGGVKLASSRIGPVADSLLLASCPR